MSVNGITTSSAETAYYNNYSNTKSAAKESKTETAENGAVYEASEESKAATKAKNTSATGAKKSKVANPELVSKMKADLNARTTQLQNIVTQLISNQGKTLGKADSIWSFLAGGDFTVDAQTKAQAQADIAEDGYWGVEATSDRIIDFATALAKDDPSQLEKMRKAFEKGYKMATKTWGGKLPDISQRTYDAVQKKFDDLENSLKSGVVEA